VCGGGGGGGQGVKITGHHVVLKLRKREAISKRYSLILGLLDLIGVLKAMFWPPRSAGGKQYLKIPNNYIYINERVLVKGVQF
jgi:hypothetical protein